jgi:hypothetical protein
MVTDGVPTLQAVAGVPAIRGIHALGRNSEIHNARRFAGP